MQGSPGEAGTNLQVTFSNRSLNMDVPVLATIKNLPSDTGCTLDDLLVVMGDKNERGARVREIRSSSAT